MNDQAYEQSRYLRTRAEAIRSDKQSQFLKDFNIEVPAPKNLVEAMKMIAAGDITLPEKAENYTFWDIGMVRWANPSVKEDQEGYNAAYKNLTVAYTRVKDDVTILPAVDALKTVQEFEALPSTSFH